MFTNQSRELESIKVRHTDIDEDQRDLILQQAFERFAGRGGLDQRLAHPRENHLMAQKLGLLVVDQQDIQLLSCPLERDTWTGFHRPLLAAATRTRRKKRRASRASSCATPRGAESIVPRENTRRQCRRATTRVVTR